jgi:hypothetical protein
MPESASVAALDHLKALAGEWAIEIVHPLLPSTVNGRVTFAWLEGSSLLVERLRIDHDDFPDGTAVIGCDDGDGRYVQCYTDVRGVCRIYQMRLDRTTWRLWRDAPGFAQRFVGTFAEDGRAVTGAWEMSKDGSTWAHDFEATFRKVG